MTHIHSKTVVYSCHLCFSCIFNSLSFGHLLAKVTLKVWYSWYCTFGIFTFISFLRIQIISNQILKKSTAWIVLMTIIWKLAIWLSHYLVVTQNLSSENIAFLKTWIHQEMNIGGVNSNYPKLVFWKSLFCPLKFQNISPPKIIVLFLFQNHLIFRVWDMEGNRSSMKCLE